MGQLGFFDADKRLSTLSAKGDPLEAIDRLVPWESFRAAIEAVMLTPDEKRKSSAGRKPFDAIVLFRMLVLQALNNLSDEQAEYQVGDRLSFTRFLRLGIEDSIPDATTLWLFRYQVAADGVLAFDLLAVYRRADGLPAWLLHRSLRAVVMLTKRWDDIRSRRDFIFWLQSRTTRRQILHGVVIEMKRSRHRTQSAGLFRGDPKKAITAIFSAAVLVARRDDCGAQAPNSWGPVSGFGVLGVQTLLVPVVRGPVIVVQLLLSGAITPVPVPIA